MGGTRRWWSASRVASDSSAPAPPSRWPVIDLVPVTIASVSWPSAIRIETGLGLVALRGRRGVGVDVLDVGGGELGFPQRAGHRPGLGLPGRVGLHHVVRVGGDPGPGQLAVDPGAAGLGVFQGLDHQHRRTLAEHEAVPVDVPGSGRALGLVVAAAHRLHLGEAGDGQRVDDAFRAADHDDVGPAEPDHVDTERDRLVAGGAGRHRRVHAGLRAEPEADVGGGRVGHQHRDGQRADPSGALLLLDVPVAEQRLQTADSGGDGHAEPFAVDRVVLFEAEAGVRPGLHGGDHAQLGRAVQPAGLDPLQDLGRIDRGDGRRSVTARSSAQSASILLTPERPASRPSQVLATSPPSGSGGAEAGDDDAGS